VGLIEIKKEKRTAMQVEYTGARSNPVDPLPEGSRIVNPTTDAVTAGAVLSSGNDLRSVEVEVTGELVQKAVQQLRERKLVTALAPYPQTTRRQ
jgi:hypothetical protein